MDIQNEKLSTLITNSLIGALRLLLNGLAVFGVLVAATGFAVFLAMYLFLLEV